MKKIITALAEPQLNNELKKEKDFIVIGKDIQYQEGVIEILETEKEVDFLIISEALPGNEKIENLIEKIKQINNEVNIVIILENKKEELEKNLYSKNVYLILYNKIEIKEIIKLIKNKKEDENEKIKKEINDLKKIIIEQNSKNKQNKKQKIKEVKELNSQKEIICILGSGGVGKSIFTVNLAKSLIYSKKKILIIDFDILNNSLHTILGVKKYSERISKKIKENNLIKDKIGLKELKIKINKRIDLISGINLLFDSKYKINNIQFNNLFNDVKKFYDVIIIDRSLFDRMIWMDRLYSKNGVSKEEYDNYINEYVPIIKNKIDIVIGTYTDSLTSLRRDYTTNVALEKRSFLSEDNVNEYNNSLLNMKMLTEKENINFYMFDTTNKSEREISFEVVDTILNNMRTYYINKLNEEFNK